MEDGDAEGRSASERADALAWFSGSSGRIQAHGCWWGASGHVLVLALSCCTGRCPGARVRGPGEMGGGRCHCERPGRADLV
eukprot:2707914-Alexandrium_andersonii.AAC.1